VAIPDRASQLRAKHARSADATRYRYIEHLILDRHVLNAVMLVAPVSAQNECCTTRNAEKSG
jgi:hypothetical protein